MIKQCPSNKNSHYEHPPAGRRRRQGVFEVSFQNTQTTTVARRAILFCISPYFLQGCYPANEDNVRNLLRSIFESMSDQESDQCTSVNKGPRPYRGGFKACIHWNVMWKHWFCRQMVLKVELWSLSPPCFTINNLACPLRQTWKRDLGLCQGMMFLPPFIICYSI